MLKFFNTLSGQLEEFRPISEGEVRLYLCGPTVWDYAHIGNFRTMAVFGDERPEFIPRATRHIDEMVDIIARLEAGGHAYVSDGSYYYRISSFPSYGKLSKINFAGNIAGASERVDTDKYDKEDARDFALWKEPASE